MDDTKRPEDVVTIDVHKAKALLSSGYRYLDVRTTEFTKSHIENALMFLTCSSLKKDGKVKNPEFLSQVTLVCKKEDHLILGCNSGGKFLRACIDLLTAGFEHISNVEVGHSAWANAGLAGDRPAEELKTSCKFHPRP